VQQVTEIPEVNDHPPVDEDFVSKSQLKREMQAMQQLGERLVGLKPEQWEQFAFGEELRSALDESRRITSHNAMRRHIRRLGKLLKEEDAERVGQLLARLDADHLQDTRRFHRIERWRDRLLEGGDGIVEELLQAAPDADRQHLRQLIRKAGKELREQKPPAASRKLFQYLKGLDID
jgi:ribosome-associated protein